MMGQFSETKTMIDELRSDINNKINAVKLELEGKLDVVSSDIHSLKAECAAKFQTNDAALNAINERVDQISQTVRNLGNRNELIIAGIPFMDGENLRAYFMVICAQPELGEALIPSIDIRRMKLVP